MVYSPSGCYTTLISVSSQTREHCSNIFSSITFFRRLACIDSTVPDRVTYFYRFRYPALMTQPRHGSSAILSKLGLKDQYFDIRAKIYRLTFLLMLSKNEFPRCSGRLFLRKCLQSQAKLPKFKKNETPD